MSKFEKDEIGTRMKENYENRAKTYLVRRTPVAIRLDGRAFHTFTKGMDKPFDRMLMYSMQDTMKYLCEKVQGCVFGYTQSDEITLILTDYKELDSSAWFDYESQKVCSVTASMATMAFNRYFSKHAEIWLDNFYESWNRSEKDEKLSEVYMAAQESGATFDARCFNIPKEEVANLLYWRQLDAVKNSVSMAAYAYFPPRELEGKNSAERKEMLKSVGINWDDYPADCRLGACCVRDEDGKWLIDRQIPMFKGEGRSYIEDRVLFTEEEEERDR